MTNSRRRSLKDALRRTFRKVFECAQWLGIDVLPRHFYSEIPDVRELHRNADWRKPYSLVSIAGADDVEAQFRFVESCCMPHTERLRRGDLYALACSRNGEAGFGKIEAEMLYCFVAEHRPPEIIQVGCGVSTATILLAADEVGYRPKITCVEPYATCFVEREAAKARLELVPRRAEALPAAFFARLPPEGLLFVDSTHTLRPGGEVPRLVLEVLPRLRKGVWTHFHDVYFPFDYARGILDDDLFFPHESILLQAFLACNESYRVEACLSILHYADKPRLGGIFPSYRPPGEDHGIRLSAGDFPSSLYLRVAN